MTDIPEDIRSAAARAVGPTIDPRGELATRVAAAILAERERCAQIAFGFTTSAHIAHDMREGNFPQRSEGRAAIAAMIRNPGHPYSPSSPNTAVREKTE